MSKYNYNKVQLYFNSKNKEETEIWEKLEELTGIGRTKQGIIKEILYNAMIKTEEKTQKEAEKKMQTEEEDFVEQFKKF